MYTLQVLEWASLSDAWFSGDIAPHIVAEPTEPPRLIPLPEDFSELMNRVSEFSCPNSEREDSKNPTMCLACGQILCSQSYCCQAEIPKVTYSRDWVLCHLFIKVGSRTSAPPSDGKEYVKATCLSKYSETCPQFLSLAMLPA